MCQTKTKEKTLKTLCFQGLMFQLALAELGRTTGSLEAVLLHPENPKPLFFKGFLFAFQDFTPISPLLFASFRVSDQTLHSQHPAAVQGGCT